jgi:transposase-like protein
LRDAKLSRKDATTASSIFKKIIETRDEPIVVSEKAPIQSDADAVVNEQAILDALAERDLLKTLNNRLKG